MTRFDSERHHRRSVRLRGFDYSQCGAYFVTICTYDRECTLGEIVGGKVCLSMLGDIAREEWLKTAKMRARVRLDAWVIMPNHIHGILVIDDMDADPGRGTLQRAPTIVTQSIPSNLPARTCVAAECFGCPTHDSIPTIIRLFKASVTKRINALRDTPGNPVWQRNYYEHVIRNHDDWMRIRHYILCNPVSWASDVGNPANVQRTGSHESKQHNAPGGTESHAI